VPNKLTKDFFFVKVFVPAKTLRILVPGHEEEYTRPANVSDIPRLLGWGEDEFLVSATEIPLRPGWYAVASNKTTGLTGWYTLKLDTITDTRFIPDSYIEEIVPATIELRTDPNIGWNSAGRSVASFVGNGNGQFSVNAGSAGVVVGLNELDDSGEVFFEEITFGIIFESGKYSVIESGTKKTAAATFSTSDVFTITRTGTAITYAKNSVDFYTSTGTSSADLLLDTSFFLSGDSVINASITDSPTPPDGDLSIDSTFPAMEGKLLGNYFFQFNEIVSNFPALTGIASGSQFVTPFAVITTDLPSLTGTINCLNGGISLDVPQILPAIEGIMSDTNYAAIAGDLPAMDGMMIDHISSILGVFGVFERTMPALSGDGTYSPVRVNNLDRPMPGLSGYGGGAAEFPRPMPRLSGDGVVHRVINASLERPMPTVSGVAKPVYVGGGSLARKMPRLSGYGGGIAVLYRQMPTLSGTGKNNPFTSANLLRPMPTLSGTGVNTVFGGGTLSRAMPRFTWYGGGNLLREMPMVKGKAIIDTENNAALVMNILTGEVTRYTNFPFDNIVEIDGKNYGVRSDGLYVLETAITTDSLPTAGTVINGQVQTKETDFGTYHSKRCPYMYVNGDTQLTITPIVDGVEKLPHLTSFSGRKTYLARGVSGRYYSFKIEGIKKLYGLEPLPELGERIRRVK
jgi:hypothetical protein